MWAVTEERCLVLGAAGMEEPPCSVPTGPYQNPLSIFPIGPLKLLDVLLLFRGYCDH